MDLMNNSTYSRSVFVGENSSKVLPPNSLNLDPAIVTEVDDIDDIDSIGSSHNNSSNANQSTGKLYLNSSKKSFYKLTKDGYKSFSGGWIEGASDENHIYYYNTITGASSWHLPVEIGGVEEGNEEYEEPPSQEHHTYDPTHNFEQVYGNDNQQYDYTNYYQNPDGTYTYYDPNDPNQQHDPNQQYSYYQNPDGSYTYYDPNDPNHQYDYNNYYQNPDGSYTHYDPNDPNYYDLNQEYNNDNYQNNNPYYDPNTSATGYQEPAKVNPVSSNYMQKHRFGKLKKYTNTFFILNIFLKMLMVYQSPGRGPYQYL